MSDFDGAAASANHDELWYVQLAADDVRTMTLDQLDEAFQAGSISAQTYVCQVGSAKWETLADVAGLEPELAPLGERAHIPDDAPVSAAQPASQTAAVLPAHAPQFPGAALTGVHAVSAPNPFLVESNHAALFDMPAHLNALSTAPVATEVGDMDVDVDVEPNEFRSRKGRVVMWIGGLASVAAIAFGVVRFRKPAVVELPPMPPGAALAPEPQVDLVAAALAAAPPVVAPEPAPAAAAPDTRLGDDTKKALAEADKSLATKQKAKQKARKETRSATAAPRKRTKSDQPFHKGGNRYDPLNSSL